MQCILCLETDNDSGHLLIHSEETQHLHIQQIVETHFALCFNAISTICRNTSICQLCWRSVLSFHEFYLRVKHIHDQYDSHDQTGNSISKIPVDQLETETVTTKDELKVIEELQIVKCSRGRLRKSKEIAFKYLEPLTETVYIADSIAKGDCNTVSEPTVTNENNEELNLDVLELDCLKNNCEDLTTNKECRFGKRRCLRPRLVSNVPTEQNATTNIESVYEDTHEDASAKDLKSIKTKEHDEFIAANYKLNCCLCQKPLDNFTSLKTHFRIQHKIEGFAVCCKKKFLKRSFLVDHIHTHLDPLYFKCPRCDKVLSTRWYLETHLKAHDDTQERNFSCDICSKSFLRRASYMQHLLLHLPEEEKKVVCTQCKKTFATTGLMNTHLRAVHMNVNVKICDICGKSIRGREGFRRHQELHAGIQHAPIQCELCGNTFTHKYGLSRHMKATHTPKEKRPQVCSICSKVSPSLFAHMRHIKYMHETERSHKCPMCNKAFKTPKNLREHITTHTGEALYTCTYCPKKFNSNANMYSHRKKVHRLEWEKNQKK